MIEADVARIAAFWKKVDQRSAEECWPWLGKLDKDGYGYFSIKGDSRKAHRWSKILSGETVPPRMHVDHQCRNRICVNPSHLRVVTPGINTLENSMAPTALNKLKTHCKNGHPLAGENLVARRGERYCRICRRKDYATYNRKKREAHLANAGNMVPVDGGEG